MGEPIQLVIDDYLPIKKDGAEINQKSQIKALPSNSTNTTKTTEEPKTTSLVSTGYSDTMMPITANKSPTGGWWLPLLEKAFAKRF